MLISNALDQSTLLIQSLHKSSEMLISIFRLIKAVPPTSPCTSVLFYSKSIEEMISELLIQIPKTCVPLSLFKKTQKEYLENQQRLAHLQTEHKQNSVQLSVLSSLVKEFQEKEKQWERQRNEWMKQRQYFIQNTQTYKKKMEILKKSGQDGVRDVMDAIRIRNPSLPRLERKQKMSLLWMIGGDRRTQNLIGHRLKK